jgi:hypothetical protein
VPEQGSTPEAAFECREPGCAESVVYKRKIVLGLGRYRRQNEPRTKIIYLTCSRGHTHRYELSG